jgi:carbon-monoxide dehydrogenase small subunit
MTVNGRAYEEEVPARLTLGDFLRETLDLTATHLGCEHGICGACTVLIDGQAARSCITLAVQMDGCEIETLEGIADLELHPVQVAFWEKHGLQCGYCTPGFVMTLVALSRQENEPTWDDTIAALGGVLCRCTGYVKIVEAARQAIYASSGRDNDQDNAT